MFAFRLLIICYLRFSLTHQSDTGDESAKILSTSPSSLRSEEKNGIELLAVSYTKPKHFSARWTFVPSCSLLKPSPIRYKDKYPSRDSFQEIVYIERKLQNNGNYTFAIEDPHNQTVKSANFTFEVFAEPSNIKLVPIGNSHPENLQYGHSYSFRCEANGYPPPDIQLNFAACEDKDTCHQPLMMEGQRGFNCIDYSTTTTVNFVVNTTGYLSCLATNPHGYTDDQVFIQPSDIENTESNNGLSLIPSIYHEVLVGETLNLTCFYSLRFRNANMTKIVNDQESSPIFESGIGPQNEFEGYEGVRSKFSRYFVLTRRNMSKSDTGTYRCKAFDAEGSELTKEVKVVVKDVSQTNVSSSESSIAETSFFEKYQIYILTFIGIGIVVTMLFIANRVGSVTARKSLELQRLEHELKRNEFDPTLPIFEMLENGPVMNPEKSFDLCVSDLDINRSKLTILGNGNFGIVQMVGLRKPNGIVQPVALKRPKDNFNVSQYRMLYAEMCLMSFLGKHQNIVNLIGNVVNISRGHLYMVMELCTEGSLLNLLRKQQNNGFYSELHQYDNKERKDAYAYELFINWSDTKANLGNLLFHSDLIGYAYQVASGMEYLASLGLVHRDLAARNILITDNRLIAKISDFGLGRREYHFIENDSYSKFPVQWTAPEALLYREFSTRSDVWSFGILLGEVFSLGEVPFFLTTHFDRNFATQLLTGQIQTPKPLYASENIHRLMLSCCRPRRQDRTSFKDAKLELEMELQRCCPNHYDKLTTRLSQIADELSNQNCEPPESVIKPKWVRTPKMSAKQCNSQIPLVAKT